MTFQYPFPDYKLPRFVFTEEAFTCPGFAPWEIIRQQSARDYTGRHAALMDERSVWPVVGHNGLIPDLANSFLVVASCTALPPSTHAGPALLAVGYTADRAAPYNVATSFWGKGEQVTVKKEPLTRPDPAEGASDRSNAVLVHRPGQEAYIVGSHFESELRKAIRADSLERYMGGLQAWLHFVYRHGVVELDARDASRSLIGRISSTAFRGTSSWARTGWPSSIGNGSIADAAPPPRCCSATSTCAVVIRPSWSSCAVTSRNAGMPSSPSWRALASKSTTRRFGSSSR